MFAPSFIHQSTIVANLSHSLSLGEDLLTRTNLYQISARHCDISFCRRNLKPISILEFPCRRSDGLLVAKLSISICCTRRGKGVDGMKSLSDKAFGMYRVSVSSLYSHVVVHIVTVQSIWLPRMRSQNFKVQGPAAQR